MRVPGLRGPETKERRYDCEERKDDMGVQREPARETARARGSQQI